MVSVFWRGLGESPVSAKGTQIDRPMPQTLVQRARKRTQQVRRDS